MNKFELGKVIKVRRKELVVDKLKLDTIYQKLSYKYLGFLSGINFVFFNKFQLSFQKLSILSFCLIFMGLGLSEVSYRLYSYVLQASSSNGQEYAFDDAVVYGANDQIDLTKVKLKSSAKIIDRRVYVLDEYFKANNSPLYGYAQKFVDTCDKYKAPKDCIVIPAIAKHETNLCKYNISAEMHNCFGWGGAGANRVKFASFDQMIDRVTDVLVNQYGREYMVDPRLMEGTFCGPQAECISWGSRILNIMNQIDDFSVSLGLGKLSNLR